MVAKKSTTKRIKKDVLLYNIVRILIAVFFIIMGISKLYGDANMVKVFELIGTGSWLMYLVGAYEVIGGVLLLRKSQTHIGAVMLLIASFGALIVQISYLSSAWIHPVLLIIGSGYIALNHKAKLQDMYDKCLAK